jgi:hypothetical protein
MAATAVKMPLTNTRPVYRPRYSSGRLTCTHSPLLPELTIYNWIGAERTVETRVAQFAAAMVTSAGTGTVSQGSSGRLAAGDREDE